MRLAALLAAILAAHVGVPAVSGGGFALQTFMKVAEPDGSELFAELRRPCGVSVVQTAQGFCKDFDILGPDCARLAEFIDELAPNSSSGECSSESEDHIVHERLGSFRLEVDDSSTHEIRRYEIAIHRGDAVNINQRTSYLCEEFGLVGDKCSILRRHLDEKSIHLELESTKNVLKQLTQGSQHGYVLEAVRRYEGIIDRLQRDRNTLHELVEEKARAYRELLAESKRELLEKARKIRLIETETKIHGQQSRVPRPPPVQQIENDDVWVHSKRGKRIPRIAAANSSISEYLKYARSSTPVIFTGFREISSSPGLPNWTIDHLRATCGHSKAMMKTKSLHRDHQDHVLSGKRTWAGLEPAIEMSLAIFLDYLDKNPDSNLYLHDSNIARFCPTLLESFAIPRFFANDFLQHVYTYSSSSVDIEDVGNAQRDYWPSLFIGGKSTSSALHADWGGTSAWMGLLQGRKHWVIASPSARGLLQEQVPTLSNPTPGRFNADLMQKSMNADEDIEWADVIRDGEIFEDVLEAGEVLFLPAECPHQVRNLDTTIAVAANFVDMGSAPHFGAYLRDEMLSSSGDKHRAFARMLQRLEDLQDAPPLFKDISYREFKAQQLFMRER